MIFSSSEKGNSPSMSAVHAAELLIRNSRRSNIGPVSLREKDRLNLSFSRIIRRVGLLYSDELVKITIRFSVGTASISLQILLYGLPPLRSSAMPAARIPANEVPLHIHLSPKPASREYRLPFHAHIRLPKYSERLL